MEKEYYYLSGETKVGPLSLDALKYAHITSGTLIWNSALPDWVEARTLPELADYFEPTAAPSPVPPTPGQTAPPPAAESYKAPTAAPLPPMPDNYLVWAILTTVFCCLPLGIVSILQANKVSTLYASGDYAGAQKASAEAKKWALWGTIIGPILYIILVVIYIFVIIAAVNSGAF
jgi:hypothetical protein